MRSTLTPNSSNVFAKLGVFEPDVELAKADLAIRIQRLAESVDSGFDQAAALLNVPRSELGSTPMTLSGVFASPAPAGADVAWR